MKCVSKIAGQMGFTSKVSSLLFFAKFYSFNLHRHPFESNIRLLISLILCSKIAVFQAIMSDKMRNLVITRKHLETYMSVMYCLQSTIEHSENSYANELVRL